MSRASVFPRVAVVPHSAPICNAEHICRTTYEWQEMPSSHNGSRNTKRSGPREAACQSQISVRDT